MVKDRHVTDNLVIQVRTGEAVGKRITDLGRAWKVSPNEAARRLLILASFGLNFSHYAAVERLASALGGGSAFLRGCDQALAALDSSDHTRRLRGEAPMTEQERVYYLAEWADQFLEDKSAPKPIRKIKKVAKPSQEGSEPSEEK